MKKLSFLPFLLLSFLTSCGNNTSFITGTYSETFLQGYNPEELDILWVVDTRSAMSRSTTIRNHLRSQAQAFFTRLDDITTADFRMGLVNMDSAYQGSLLPYQSPIVLTKGMGDANYRLQLFNSIFSTSFNLTVSATNTGFQSAYLALTSSFVPRAGIPLVLLFMSDSDDHSSSSSTSYQTYANQFLALKQNQSDKLRVYAVNYLTNGQRCATQDNVDISLQNYFALANSLSGATSDLCGNFSSNINLSGLATQVLPRRFHLERRPNPASIQIAIFNTQTSFLVPPYTYDATSNDIEFQTPPQQGATIQISYTL